MADRVVPVDVRNAIVTWSDDAHRGAVSRFCAEYGVSRSQFYEIRARARTEGPVAAMLPRPRRVPDRHRQAVPLQIEELAVRIRKELADGGWDHGPISVRHRLLELGVRAPAASTLARVFTGRGMVEPQPQKRPRTSWRRFQAATVHECWQLDAFEWPLADGTIIAILQLLDDKSRFMVASRAAPGERAEDAIAVVNTAIARFQVPCRLLSDNGSAFNQDRLGKRTQLGTMLRALGCKPISGAIGHPQTQGKNERVHATLQRWLRAHDQPETIEQMQTLLDEFDWRYNQRPHQSLGMRTPAQAFAEGPTAFAPLPPEPTTEPSPTVRARQLKVGPNGNLRVAGICLNTGYENRGTIVTTIEAGQTINVFNATGTLIRTVNIEPGRTYYGNGKPRGPRPRKRLSGLT